MEPNLIINAVNYTPQGWHLVLYKKKPAGLGKNVAWKVLSLSKPQPYSTSGTISWNLNCDVIVPQAQEDNYYTGNVHMDAKEGCSYEAVMEDGYVQIKESGSGEDGYIFFRNNTEKPRDLGIRMSGSLILLQDEVASGMTASFQLTSTYCLALFSNFNQHEDFDPAKAAADPVTIEFPPGLNTARVEALLQNGDVMLSVTGYSYTSNDN